MKKIRNPIANYNKQVESFHYDFGAYVKQERWISYYSQISEVREIAKILNKRSVKILEIGPGDGIVTSVLKNMGMKVVTMDIDPDLKPDYISALPKVTIPDRKRFDCVLCCEVLEHIRYKDVEESLRNISKVSDYAIISVPHVSLSLSFSLKFIYFETLKALFSIDLGFRKHKFAGQHYWEIGYRGYDKRRFTNSLQKSGLKIIKDFRIKEHPWHHFFIVESIYLHE